MWSCRDHAWADLEQFAARDASPDDPTLVICDEPHHVGENRRWGEAHDIALLGATFRLYLTATPFRSGGEKIAGFTYTDGVADELYSFSYRDALRQGRLNPNDRCVTPVVVHPFDGDISWYEGVEGERREFTKKLSDESVTGERERRRRRWALYPKGTWLNDVLRAADDQLTSIREQHPDAAGIVWARDVEHARAIHGLLESITRDSVVLVHADIDGAADAIGDFVDSRQRWIVAVRMVSEGVDIPRLRVGVVACLERTPLYFMQMAGRIMRWVPTLNGIDQSGHLFLPAEPSMMALAADLEKDVAVALMESTEEAEHHERERYEQLEFDEGFLDSKPKAFYLKPHGGQRGDTESILHTHAVGLVKRRNLSYEDALAIIKDLYETGALRLDSFRVNGNGTNGSQRNGDYEVDLAEVRTEPRV